MSTSITKKMTINGEGKDVVLDGLDFTADGLVEIYQAGSVTIRNCRIYGLNAPSSRNYWLRIFGDIPVRVQIEHCFFGSNQPKMYNLLEMKAKLQEGSTISDNYFSVGSCSHNTINIYGADENAFIHVNRNVFEESAGTVRIGVKGEPTCNIELLSNRVLANKSGESELWYGLCCVQPCGTETSTFANMTLTMSDNKLTSRQAVYGYSGSKDTALNAENMPKVTVDGDVVSPPIYH